MSAFALAPLGIYYLIFNILRTITESIYPSYSHHFALHPLLSNTYEKVQANANQIWKYNRYHLVMEYEQRPVLVPPFIIVNHMIYAIMFLYRCLRNRYQRGGNGQGNSNGGSSKSFLCNVFKINVKLVYTFTGDCNEHTTQSSQLGQNLMCVSSECVCVPQHLLQDDSNFKLPSIHSGNLGLHTRISFRIRWNKCFISIRRHNRYTQR